MVTSSVFFTRDFVRDTEITSHPQFVFLIRDLSTECIDCEPHIERAAVFSIA